MGSVACDVDRTAPAGGHHPFEHPFGSKCFLALGSVTPRSTQLEGLALDAHGLTIPDTLSLECDRTNGAAFRDVLHLRNRWESERNCSGRCGYVVFHRSDWECFTGVSIRYREAGLGL